MTNDKLAATFHGASLTDTLRPILAGYRELIQPAWSPATAHEGYIAKRGNPTGQCGVTSAWLLRRLREDIGVNAVFCSGSVVPNGRGASLRDHCWLEVGTGIDRIVVDLTIDQAFPEAEFAGRHGDLMRSLHYTARRRLSPELMLNDPVQIRLALLTEVVEALSTSHRKMLVTQRDGRVHVVLYDAADAEAIESRTWSVIADGSAGLFYAASNAKNSDGERMRLRMHSLLMGRSGVDHINRNGLDNRRSNLRFASPSQNSANRAGRPDGSSQYKGVHWHRGMRKWAASMKAVDRQRHLGYFTDEAEAARVYDAAAREAFGEYAYLNFPEAAR